MSICPWCKGQMTSASDVCPSCGKSPHEHPSISAGNFGSFEAFDDDFGDDLDDGGGRLDLEGAVEPLTDANGPDVFGGDSFEQDTSSVQLDVDIAPVRAARPQVPPDVQTPPGPQGPLPPRSYRGAAEEQAEQPAFDPYEIAVLADFGPRPEKIWEFPSYTLRVTSRRRVLLRRMQLVQQSVHEAEQSRDNRLADMAERLRPQLERSKELGALLETLRQVEATAASRNEALSSRNQELQEKLSVVDREVEGVRNQETASKARLDAAAQALDQERDGLERANAAKKRAEIELRNAQQVARAAAGPQARTAPPEHAAKLQNLTRILEERQASLQAPRALFDEAKRVWNDADSAHKVVQRRIADLQKQRRGIEQSYAQELGMRSAGVQQAESERRAAYVAIGARLIEMNASIVPRELRQAFFESQEMLSARQVEAERLKQAIASADPQAVKKGWMVLMGGSGLALVLLIVVIALFGRTEPSYDSSSTLTGDANGAARHSCVAPGYRA